MDRLLGNTIVIQKYFVQSISGIWIISFINPMTQSSLQNKGVTHSSMFAEVHFTNASSLPQIPMQCMHCKMLANICMSLLKLIFLWSFPDVSWASLDSDHDITNNAMQVRIHPWTWFWLGFVLTAFIKPDLSIQLSKAVREPQWEVGLWKVLIFFLPKPQLPLTCY